MASVRKIKSELVAIVWVGLGAFLAAALWSYNPADTSFHTFTWGKAITNWCGFVGSFISDALLRLFGLSAWILVAALVVRGAMTGLRHYYSWSWVKTAWGLSLFALSTALLQSYFPESRFYEGNIMLGGLFGMILSKGFGLVFNQVGALVVFWVTWAVCFVMYFEHTISDAVKYLAGLLSRGAMTAGRWISYQLVRLYEGSVQQVKKTKKTPPLLQPKLVMASPDPVLEEYQQLALGDYQELEEPEAEPDTPPPQTVKRRKVEMRAARAQKVENWNLPKLALIEDPPAARIRVDQGEIKERARILKDKLSLFGVTGEVVAAKSGPAVTLYEFRPESSVKISKITELADDLAMALSSESLRIIAPIPGRDVVGIETANRQRETVYHKDMLAEEKFWSEDYKLPMALGRRVDGAIEIADLRKMPHLLIAGTTGSGKSVFTVSTIIGLIYRHSPKTLKLILIDPKQVDLAAFEKIPHLAMPLVTDSRQAVLSLKWAVNEMEKRYRSMSKFGARGLEAFNDMVADLNEEQKKEHEQANFEYETTPGKRGEQYYYEPQPYLVIVVEEFADLMSVDKGNVEQAVIRLAQKARACGIHLILCLQSPRKEFVTGAIKSNIPGRIAFKAASSMESRIILDEGGAERLLASGDMLYRGPGSSHVIRHHGPFLKDKDISNTTEFWSDQAEPTFDPQLLSVLNGSESDGGGTGYESLDDDQDNRYGEIMDWLQTQKEVSASLIQRRFALGYPRAARLMETFERQGVVGPANGSKPRQVLIHNLREL